MSLVNILYNDHYLEAVEKLKCVRQFVSTEISTMLMQLLSTEPIYVYGLYDTRRKITECERLKKILEELALLNLPQ
jgi:hypothetical protein